MGQIGAFAGRVQKGVNFGVPGEACLATLWERGKSRVTFWGPGEACSEALWPGGHLGGTWGEGLELGVSEGPQRPGIGSLFGVSEARNRALLGSLLGSPEGLELGGIGGKQGETGGNGGVQGRLGGGPLSTIA